MMQSNCATCGSKKSRFIKEQQAMGILSNLGIFIVDKINDAVPYTYNLKDINDEEIIGSFYDKELQKTKL